MASYARDIYFGVRVEDRATRPLRRIAREFQSLGKQELARRQFVGRRADLAVSRAQNTRRAAAQEYLAAKRAYDLDVKRARLAVERAREAERAALVNQRAAQRALTTDVENAQLRAQRAQDARRAAATRYMKLRSDVEPLAVQRREAQANLARTRAMIQQVGLGNQLEKLDQRRLSLTTRLEQVQLALAQRGTKLGQQYEENLAKADSISPRVLARSRRGILMPQMTTNQLNRELARLQGATRTLARDEQILSAKAGLAEKALSVQTAQVERLAAAEKVLNAQTAGAAARFRTASTAARQAAANVPITEAKAQERVVSTTKNLTLARQRYNLAVESGAAIEANSAARLARSTNTLRAASDGYRLARERAAQLNQEIENFRTDRLRGIATYIRHIGFALTTVGAIGVFAFAALGKSAADFETQATLAATQSTMAGKNTIAQVRKNASFIQREILKLQASGQVISSAPEQTSAAYKIFSGVSLPGKTQNAQLREGIRLLKDFNQVAVANVGLVSLEEATRAGIILFNRFGVTVDQMPKKLNTFQAAVRFGDITMSEFLGTLGTVAPAAQGAGYSVEQMSAAIAFLSKQFSGNLRLGTTGYARLLEIFARQDVIDGLKEHGVAITKVENGVRKLLPIEQIARNIIDKFGGSVKNGSVFLQNFFKQFGNTQGTIQARRVLVTYLQHLEGAKRTLRDVTSDHNELEKSLRAAQESPAVRWQQFVVQLKAIAIEIGQGVIPTVVTLARHVRSLGVWFNNLSPNTKRAIGSLGAFIAVATLLSGIILTIVGAILSLSIAVGGLKGSRGFGGLSKSIGGVLGARGLAGVATEAGEARVLFAAGLGIPAIIGSFILFHKQTMMVINALGGLNTALGLLSSFAGALVLQRLTVGLLAVAARAGIARTALTGLGSVLGGGIFKIIAITAIAGALFLFSHRADAARERLAKLREEQKKFNDFLKEGVTAAKSFSSQGLDLRALQESANNLEEINIQIRGLQRTVRTSTGSEKRDSQVQLNQLYLQRARILDDLTTATDRYNKSLSGFDAFQGKQEGYQERLAKQFSRLENLKELKDLLSRNIFQQPNVLRQVDLAKTLGIDPDQANLLEKVNALLETTKVNISGVQRASDRAGQAFKNSIRKMLTDLQHANLVPGHVVTEGVVQDVRDLMVKLNRTLTLRELKLVMQAEINPNKPPEGLVEWVAKFIKRRYNIRVTAELDTKYAKQRWTAFLNSIGGFLPQMPKPPKPPIVKPEDITPTVRTASVSRSIQQWINMITEAKALAEKSPSLAHWTAYYKLLEQLEKKFSGAQLQAIEELINAQTDAQKKYSDKYIISEARRVAQLARIARQEKTFAAYKAFYDALDKLSSDASSSQMQAIEKMFNLTVDNAEKTRSKLKDIYNDVFNNIKQQYDTFLQQNQSAFGTLFSGPYIQSAVTQNRLDWGQVLNTKDLIKDLDSQVKQFRKWRHTIEQLRRRGLPKSLVDQILALGPEAGMQQAELLAKATPEQLKRYKALWKQGQKEIHDATMRDLNNQLNDWRRHGRRIALAIARGLRDENVALENALKAMIEKAFPGLKAGGAGPHTDKNNSTNDKPASRNHRGSPHHRQTSTQTEAQKAHDRFVTEEHTHYHVTGVGSEADLKTQVKHADFQRRSRFHHRR